MTSTNAAPGGLPIGPGAVNLQSWLWANMHFSNFDKLYSALPDKIHLEAKNLLWISAAVFAVLL